MLKITAALKEHLVKSFAFSATGTDDEARALVSAKIVSGELEITKVDELTKATEASSKLDELITSKVKSAVDPLTAAMTQLVAKFGGAAPAQETTPAVGAKSFDTDADGRLVVKSLATGTPREALVAGAGTGSGAGTSNVRVKCVSEQFDRSTKGLTYDMSRNPFLKKHFGGQPVYSAAEGEGARVLNVPSQFDNAIAGAFFKLAVLNSPRDAGVNLRKFHLTELDKQLVEYALNELPWTGMIGYNESADYAKHYVGNRKLSDLERKGLLDDVQSGGLEAAPIVFDDAVITTPLLHGQLFPLVKLVNITRGRRIEAFSIGNPTFTWGTAEGTAIDLFDTAGFIAAFDNTIFPSTGAMQIGLDFEEDSPNDIGAMVVQNYGEAALNTLDYVVAMGNGTTQPEGVFNASGVTVINSDNGPSGPPTLSDYEGLLFGVVKEYRAGRAVYITNDVSYRRSRGLKVDPNEPSTDERRLLGMTHESYETLGHQHRINHSVPNGKQGFFDLGRYRMYRRLGLQIRIERAGQTLALSNQQLIVCRMRMGGSLEQGAAGCVIEDGQS